MILFLGLWNLRVLWLIIADFSMFSLLKEFYGFVGMIYDIVIEKVMILKLEELLWFIVNLRVNGFLSDFDFELKSLMIFIVDFELLI